MYNPIRAERYAVKLNDGEIRELIYQSQNDRPEFVIRLFETECPDVLPEMFTWFECFQE
jgi:hypothetical protein